MRFRPLAVGAGVVLFAVVLFLVIKPKHVPGGPGPDGKISVMCTGAAPDVECRVLLREFVTYGGSCNFSGVASSNHTDGSPHDPFHLSVSDGDTLRIVPEAGNVRFRNFTQDPKKAGCAAIPFVNWTVPKDFVRKDVTGKPDPRAYGCPYKITVQSDDEGADPDPSHPTHHPEDPADPVNPADPGGPKHHYFCVDPHFEMLR